MNCDQTMVGNADGAEQVDWVDLGLDECLTGVHSTAYSASLSLKTEK